MKNTFYRYVFLLVALTSVLAACQKFLDINVDPTLKGDASLRELLPPALFYTGEASYYQALAACQYIQQIGSVLGPDGLDSQTQYDNSDGWHQFYLNTLPPINLMIGKGQSENAPAYAGIAKILLAYNLGLVTVSWENVPYSQADQKNFAPAYDSQQSIYASVQKLLQEGIEELQKNTGAKPGADDLIYAGDLSKWIKLAYTLKARFALHLSVKNPQQAAQSALDAALKGFSSNADDFELNYNAKNLNPWYSRVALANSTGNFSVTHSAAFIDMLKGRSPLKDPRLPKLAALQNGHTEYQGAKPGEGTGATVNFATNSWNSNIRSPLEMATYAEVKALEAEARFILHGGTPNTKGTTAQGYAAYLEIINANMKNMRIADDSIAAYLSNPLTDVGAANLTLSDILAEKNKAMFLNGDMWTDFRRYDYLNMSVPANLNVDLQGKFIQRFTYPASETTRNSDAAKQNIKPINEKMWMFVK